MRRPVAFVTTFGLGRTPAQVGMLQALADRAIKADVVVGTSLGAVNAAALAAGRTPEQMAEFWNWLHEEILGSPVRAIARGVTGMQVRRQEGQVRARIAELLPGEFAGLRIPLRLLATDLATGGEVVLDSGDLVDAVMASCALPGVFPPVAVRGRDLIDGGLVAGMPLRAVPDGAGTIISLDTGHSAVPVETVAGYRWWEVAALSYAHQVRGQAVHALVLAAARAPVVLLTAGSDRLLEFPDPAEMIADGLAGAET
ncbi:MAG TPA: patatin-like phospholipase family protein, partial [Actinomycetota bacterium]|nr:patatin-like phospholipase family protein [Actinomycetota bacterium]